jgi:uncharacterized phiE125 gp8 family phage protein
MRLELITAPAVEPVSVADAKGHLRVDEAVTAEDALIARHIIAARRLVEAYTRRKLVTQKWRLLRDSFCAPIVLGDLAPVATIDAVKYIDTAGALQTLDPATYQLLKEAPARVVLAFDKSWPDLRGDREGVRVEVTCGYGGAAAVPEDITAALLLLVADLYEKREPSIHEADSTVDALLSSYIVAEF